MKFDTTFKEMELVFNELSEQFEAIKKNEERIPQIEIDIFKVTLQKLYKRINQLNKMDLAMPVEKPAKELIEKTVSIDSPIEKEMEDLNTSKNEVTDEKIILNDELEYEKVTNDFLQDVNNPPEISTEDIEEPIKDELDTITSKNEEVKPSLLLQFEDEIFSVNDSIAQKAKDKSLVNKLSSTRIENLKSAIGINDKFYFINELFGGNSQAYEDVIYTLNNFKRFEEAMQYVSTLKYRYDWKTETEAYQKLVHFLERKFIEIHA